MVELIQIVDFEYRNLPAIFSVNTTLKLKEMRICLILMILLISGCSGNVRSLKNPVGRQAGYNNPLQKP